VEKLGDVSKLWETSFEGWMSESGQWSENYVRAALASRAPRQLSHPGSEAAVAMILRFARQPEVLLIRRSEQSGDPWSGHMALPGGRREPADPSCLETAIRETREEVGIELAHQGELLGRLDDVTAIARGRPLDLVIVPFVFVLREAVTLTPSGEVDQALWADLEPLAAGRAAGTRPYVYQGQTLELPAFRVGPHLVWGLTYHMLTMLFALLRGEPPPSRPPRPALGQR
jgi:8-oxo-dGTP pyrophosphatase MutT (NUDIX family)